MVLTLGSRLGPYEILLPLGAGGMGEVYRGRNTKLGREVALKVLPEAFAKDAEGMARFRREAQAASALNHPNICTIHDIGEYEGQPFIAMEFLEGESLYAVPVPVGHPQGVPLRRWLPALTSVVIVAAAVLGLRPLRQGLAHQKGAPEADRV